MWRFMLRKASRTLRTVWDRFDFGEGLVVVLAAGIGIIAGHTVVGFY